MRWSPPVSAGTMGSARWPEAKHQQGTAGRKHRTLNCFVTGTCDDQTVGQRTRWQCNDLDDDLVSHEMREVLRESGIPGVVNDACEFGHLYAGWSLSAERCVNLSTRG